MQVNMEGQGYWYDDTKFRKEDKLLSANALLPWLEEDPGKAGQLCALGCLVQHIVYQGDEAQDYDLLLGGDPRSDWVKLFRMEGEPKKTRDGKMMRTKGKEIDFQQGFDLLMAAHSLIGSDVEPHVLDLLGSPEPNLYKVLAAGMCAKMDPSGISLLTAVPGIDKMAAKILQLRM